MKAILLAAHAVRYTTGEHTLVDDVSLELYAGEVLILVGPNGAGKTTLLRLLSGELPPTAGEVTLGGVELRHLSALQQARQRAVLRQQSAIAFPFTTFEVALMGRYPHLNGQRESSQDHALANAALEQTELRPFAERIVPSLSGGEQTRVNLARVLAQATPILLLDEPTAALDLRHQHLTMQHARRIADAGGAVLAVVHDLNLAASYADRIGLLHRGRLVLLDTPANVLTAAQLSAVYNVPVVVQPHPTLPIPLVLVLPRGSPSEAQESAAYAA